MGTLSCHSNQSSYPTGIKKHNLCRGQCPKHVCQVSASSPIWFLRRRFLNIFTKIDPFSRPDNQSNSPIWTKVIWNIEDYSINISVKKNQNIPNETENIVNFLFSHYKSKGTISCHSNQSSYPIGIKTQLFVPPTYRWYMWNMRRNGLTASEEMWFENVDRRTDDGYLHIL